MIMKISTLYSAQSQLFLTLEYAKRFQIKCRQGGWMVGITKKKIADIGGNIFLKKSYTAFLG